MTAIATHKATIHTNHGDIVVDLFGNHAPKTVKNFVGLSDGSQEWADPRTGEKQNGPLYKDVVFHRIIKDFMIQGGDPLGQGIGGPGYNFDDEIHPELNFNAPYMLAMANAGLRNGRGTNGSQFFITTAPTRGCRASTPSSVRLLMRIPRRSWTSSTTSAPVARTAPWRMQ